MHAVKRIPFLKLGIANKLKPQSWFSNFPSNCLMFQPVNAFLKNHALLKINLSESVMKMGQYSSVSASCENVGDWG